MVITHFLILFPSKETSSISLDTKYSFPNLQESIPFNKFPVVLLNDSSCFVSSNSFSTPKNIPKILHKIRAVDINNDQTIIFIKQ